MRYIMAVGRRIIGLLRCLFTKLIYPKSFSFHPYNLVSLSTQFLIRGNGKIFFSEGVSTKRNCDFRVNNNAKIVIGKNSFFNNNCILVSHLNISVGDECAFGPNCAIFDHDHDFRVSGGIAAGKYRLKSIEIGNNVWVGSNVVILKGTKIGDNSVIAAGCIVSGEYPANSIIVQKRETTIIPIDETFSSQA
jgi:acetyltransferase-like isoleucine patch superfamily enzyme